jgi:hypothetical protein
MYNIDIYYRTSLKNTSVSGASWINIIIIIIIIIIFEEHFNWNDSKDTTQFISI